MDASDVLNFFAPRVVVDADLDAARSVALAQRYYDSRRITCEQRLSRLDLRSLYKYSHPIVADRLRATFENHFGVTVNQHSLGHRGVDVQDAVKVAHSLELFEQMMQKLAGADLVRVDLFRTGSGPRRIAAAPAPARESASRKRHRELLDALRDVCPPCPPFDL